MKSERGGHPVVDTFVSSGRSAVLRDLTSANVFSRAA
jgi:hypothetical protein